LKTLEACFDALEKNYRAQKRMLEGTYTKKSKKVKDGEPEKGENEKPEESKVVNNEKNKRALRRT